jgi:hypothetical protein
MPALDQFDPRNVAIREAEGEASYMRQTTPQQRALDSRDAIRKAQLVQRAEAAAQSAQAKQFSAEQRALTATEKMAFDRERFTAQSELAWEKLSLSDMQRQIAEERFRLMESDSKAKAARELQVTREANGFLRDAIGMDPTKPSFDLQLQDMLAGYPNAPESKAVQMWINHHVGIAVKLRTAKEATPDQSNIKSLEKERALYASEFAKARSRRIAVGKKGDSDLNKAADADVTEYQTKLADVENRIRALRGHAPATPQPATPAPAKAPDEKISVVHPDGRTGKIPRSQLDAALKLGYKAQ